eukprot:m.946692 g.946692  ORF g.946692 m.946692 type:complete len:394 (+) comp23847_c0_seq36:421-1602(+)
MRRRASQTMLPQIRSVTLTRAPSQWKRESDLSAVPLVKSSRTLRERSLLVLDTPADEIEDGHPRRRDNRMHDFAPHELMHPGWCDFCDELVWGLSEAAMVCSACNFMCHAQCVPKLRIDCLRTPALFPLKQEATADTLLAGALSKSTTLDRAVSSGVQSNSDKIEARLLRAHNVPNIEQRVSEYNKQAFGYKISCSEGGVFSGRIPIYINLAKPVRVHAGRERMEHACEDEHESRKKGTPDVSLVRLAAGLCKHVHVNSTMTAGDVVALLLMRLKISSPKSKFALYELDLESTRSRQLQPTEEPLVLQLLWGSARTNVLSLQNRPQDESAQAWETFALIELENFVCALDREEQRFVQQIERDYERRRQRLRVALKAAVSRRGRTGSTGLHSAA